MGINKDFVLKQYRYDMMWFFNKTYRNDAPVPYKEIESAIKDFCDMVVESENLIMSSISSNYSVDDYTSGHSVNVCMISILIGNLLGYDKENLKNLAISAFLHDIGKKFIDSSIIFKPGKLTDEEFEVIKQHPRMGFEHLKEKYAGEIPDDVLRGVLDHHERIDNSGYPDKKGWHEISEFGRIIAIADVYEAYTASRSYHTKRSISEGTSFLRCQTGLDLDIVDLFLTNTTFYPNGMYLVLSDDSVVVVNKDRKGLCPSVNIPGDMDNVIDIREKKIVNEFG